MGNEPIEKTKHGFRFINCKKIPLSTKNSKNS